ncbi:MAG: oligogalacturonate lyase family protein [Puniceicoccaceae bacterium]
MINPLPRTAMQTKLKSVYLLPVILAGIFAGNRAFTDQVIPKEWIDVDTGHRVIRLSENAGTASFYFHQNAYSGEGDKVVVTMPGGIGTIDLETHENRLLVEKPRARTLVVGKLSRSIYYTLEEEGVITVYAAHLDSGEIRRIAELPGQAMVYSLNADETLLLGSLYEATPEEVAAGRHRVSDREFNPQTGQRLTYQEQREWGFKKRLDTRLPMAMFVIDTATGEVCIVHRATDWLNHLQFSPTDPERILFCHEGPWHMVDRLWTIKTDGSDLRKLHERTMNMEIWGHEFFSPDGKTVWYDLQRPRGEVFWLASVDLETGKRTWYAHERNEWSCHYNISPDMSIFAGDGGDADMVAHAPDGKWIYLFRPTAIPDTAGMPSPNSEDLIHPGRLIAEKLVNMKDHDYKLEPNVTFTPDGKWIVFRSNMHGEVHTYAVEVDLN